MATGTRTPLFSKRQVGGMFAIVNVPTHPNDIYWVNSVTGTDSAGNGRNPDAPFATINYAITQCTASKGDVIYVMPGHAESISGVAAIAANVIGVTILGLGAGTLRPTITFHTTTTTIAVSAANVTFRNLLLTNDIDDVVSMFNITAAGCTLDAVDYVEGSAVGSRQLVLTTSAATDLTIQNCRWIQTVTAAGALMQWIKLVGVARAKITNNFAHLKGFATSNPANGVINATTASTQLEITSNRFIIVNSTGNIPISLTTNSTGWVGDNRVASTKTAVAGSIALASCYGANNLAAHTVNTAGILDPIADS